MRRLVLLALVALVAVPLSAHDRHWRRPRRVVVVEDSYRRPYDRGEYRHWDEDRWEHRDYERRYSRRDECDDDDRVVLRPLPRPLAPPFQGRVEFWIH